MTSHYMLSVFACGQGIGLEYNTVGPSSGSGGTPNLSRYINQLF